MGLSPMKGMGQPWDPVPNAGACRLPVAAGLWLCAVVGVGLPSAPAHACRLYAAALADAPSRVLEQHLIGDASDHPSALKRLGSPHGGNVDGWGLVHMAVADDDLVVRRSAVPAGADPAFDVAVMDISTVEPAIVLAHVRNCTSGCCAHGAQTVDNPHPFYRSHGGRTWAFAHKGTVSKERLVRLLGPDYLSEHALTGSGVAACDPTHPELVVDSELLFVYLLKSIEQIPGPVEVALARAVTALRVDGEWGEMTFVLSDGATLWAHGGLSRDGALYLLDGDGIGSVAVEPPAWTNDDWLPVPMEHIATLRPGQSPRLVSIADLIGTPLLVNPGFESWIGGDGAQVPVSGDLRDWSVSSGSGSGIITLDTSDVGDNATRKVRFGWPPQAPDASGAYLTQRFAQPMRHAFGVQLDVSVETVSQAGNGTSAHLFIGDDRDSTEADEDCASAACGPCSSPYERFVSLALWQPPEGPARQGEPMTLVAQRREDGPDDVSTWPSVSHGLALGQWHTIRLVVEPEACAYSAWVVGDPSSSPARVPAGACFSPLTHISVAQCCGGAAVFHIDNVQELLQVINVVGSTRRDAAAKLASGGLRVGSVRAIPARNTAPGTVLAQEPAAGAWVPGDTAVDLVVADSLASRFVDATPHPLRLPSPNGTERARPPAALRGNTVCLIEALAPGPAHAPALDALRWLRDHVVVFLPGGRLFIKLYYDLSALVLREDGWYEAAPPAR